MLKTDNSATCWRTAGLTNRETPHQHMIIMRIRDVYSKKPAHLFLHKVTCEQKEKKLKKKRK